MTAHKRYKIQRKVCALLEISYKTYKRRISLNVLVKSFGKLSLSLIVHEQRQSGSIRDTATRYLVLHEIRLSFGQKQSSIVERMNKDPVLSD